MNATVTITSAHLPTITLDANKPASDEPNPYVRALLGWLKPRVVVKAWGEEVATYTPAGKPEGNDWPLYGLVFGGLALLGAFIFLRGIFKR